MAVTENNEDVSRPGIASRWVAGLNLRQRILLLLSLAALPGIVVAVFLATSWLQDQSSQIETGMARLAKLAAARQETVIENARVMLTAVAQGYTQAGDDGEECRAYLSGWLKEFHAFTSLTRYGANGAATCASHDTELAAGAADAEWFKRVREERKFVLGRYTLGRSGTPLLVAAYPLLDASGAFTGVLALGIDLRWLDFLADTVELPADATITALNERGEILSHNTADSAKEGAKLAVPSQTALQQMGVLTSGTLLADDVSGSPRIYGFQKTSQGNVVIAVGHTPYLGYAEYRDALVHTLAAPLLVLVLALAAAGYASEALVTRYVRSLTHTAEAIEQGDLSARSEIPYGQYEIGRLAAAFDGMAAAIEENQSELEDLAEEREMLIRELNHRVKNNLQIVLSMLRGGQNALDTAAREHLKTLSGRVQTLAQIHHLLYEKYDADLPPLPSYVQELTKLLGEFYGAKVGPAKIDADVASVDLGLSQSISFGLILNELVANAQKHAFPDQRGGRIAIRLYAETIEGRSHVHLVVTDDGVGLPPDFDLVGATSMGSRIIRALARQLDGEVWGERLDPGTAMHLRFPD